jgi:hypothetical protein
MSRSGRGANAMSSPPRSGGEGDDARSLIRRVESYRYSILQFRFSNFAFPSSVVSKDGSP